jgi:hypothetical protein
MCLSQAHRRSVCVSCKKGTAAKGFCFIGKQQTGRADRRRHRDEGEIKSSPRTKGGLNTLLFFPHAMPRPHATLFTLSCPFLRPRAAPSQMNRTRVIDKIRFPL